MKVNSKISIEKKMKNKIKIMVLTALFAALITLGIYLFKIPTGSIGYIHIGDSLIYLASCILPFPFGMLAGGIGGAIADTVSGFPIYIIPTFIIKMLNSACFYAVFVDKKMKLVCVRTYIALALTSLVTPLGYFVAETILYGFEAAIATILSSCIQAIGAAVVFLVIAISFDKNRLTLKIKKQII